jgi:hypothetical protein
MRRAVLMTRQAISPRLAMRIFVNITEGCCRACATGWSSFLSRSIARLRQIRLRVSFGMITSSM